MVSPSWPVEEDALGSMSPALATLTAGVGLVMERVGVIRCTLGCSEGCLSWILSDRGKVTSCRCWDLGRLSQAGENGLGWSKRSH